MRGRGWADVLLGLVLVDVSCMAGEAHGGWMNVYGRRCGMGRRQGDG